MSENLNGQELNLITEFDKQPERRFHTLELGVSVHGMGDSGSFGVGSVLVY